MKKLIAVSLFFVTIGLLMGGGFHAENLKVNVEKKDNMELVRYTFISPLRGRKYWSLVEDGMTAASKEIGIDIKFTGPTQLSSEEQIKCIEAAIASKVDGIITMALNPEGFTPVINKAAESGIPVVLIDTDAPSSMRSAYVGTNNRQAGIEAGKSMIKATGGKASIAIITGALGQANLNDRIEGFREAIKNQPEMKIVTIADANSDILRINERTQSILNLYPNVDAVFCTEGYGTIVVPQIIEDKKLTDKITVIGFDGGDIAIESIKKGILYSSIRQNPYEMGSISVKLLKQIIDGKTPLNPVIDTGITVLTKDSL